MVDLRSENIKWYHFINFNSKVVVLGYFTHPVERRMKRTAHMFNSLEEVPS
jgi:hypothetical protein